MILFDLPVEAGMGENGGACGEKDDEFYETIEAPKYVDFTLPALPLLDDDRSWFCSRAGECLVVLLCCPVYALRCNLFVFFGFVCRLCCFDFWTV